MGNDALPYIQSINDRVMKLFNSLPKRQLSPEQQKEIRKEVNAIVKEELGEMVSAMKLSQNSLADMRLNGMISRLMLRSNQILTL